MSHPERTYSEADVRAKVIAAKASVAMELEQQFDKKHEELLTELQRLSDLEQQGQGRFDPAFARQERVSRIGNHLVLGLSSIEADIQMFFDERKYFHPETVEIIERKLKSLKNALTLNCI